MVKNSTLRFIILVIFIIYIAAYYVSCSGYYEYHTPYEYVVAEEMDKAVSIGFYLINRLGLKEHFIPFTSRYRVPENPDYDYFAEKFKQ